MRISSSSDLQRANSDKKIQPRSPMMSLKSSRLKPVPIRKSVRQTREVDERHSE